MKKIGILIGFLLLALCLLCACKGESEHVLTHHPAVASTCALDGHIEYWSCEECGDLFADEKGTQKIADESETRIAKTEDHTYNSRYVCEICGHKRQIEGGLIYTINEAETAYTVRGVDPEATTLVIPDTHEGKPVTAIAERAFENYTKLSKVTIPPSITAIGVGAFGGCDALREVHISDVGRWCGIEFADGSSNPLVYAKNLYVNGSLAEALTVPDTVTAIGSYAFYNCASLKSIVLPAGLASIGEGAFAACSYMNTCELPAGLTEIGADAFFFCRSLASVSLPATLTSIGVNAFDRSGVTAASFAATEGWTVNGVAMDAAALSDPATAAAALVTTYVESEWKHNAD